MFTSDKEGFKCTYKVSLMCFQFYSVVHAFLFLFLWQMSHKALRGFGNDATPRYEPCYWVSD